jgi:alpha-glucosidase (family GH31 glycosyl hydrolase)
MIFLTFFVLSVLCKGQLIRSYKQSAEEVNVKLTDGTLSIFPLADNSVRIRFYNDVQPQDTELIFIRDLQKPGFKITDSPSALVVKGRRITVSVDKQTGTLSFTDNSGRVFLKEKENSRKLIPDTVRGQSCFRAEQSFESPNDEYLFGLGQFQDGHYNIKNITRRLTQVNSQISLPFIFSSKGYGLLWHQYGLTDFNPADNFIMLEKQEKSTGSNQSADVTTTAGTRVCILARSAFLGQQRYGAINWSGDVGGTWDAYRRQIVGGLNYTITGLPYWTTDIGGFFRPRNTQYTDEKYQELLTRWYQWGTFNPIFRIHGFQSETEPWKYGQQVEDNMRKMLNLRYRLIPYIYSEAYQITKNGSTIMRPLIMDFSGDITALNQPFEYMFGKAFLVAPITQPDITEWNVYLLKSTAWYDFWTGQKYDGSQTVKTSAPLNKIPLFVRAGSIVPMGKMIQYTGQLPSDTIEIRIYKGADGRFMLYEDESDNYNYERGICSTIEFRWSNTSSTLTIGKRNGEFPGMLKTKTFKIVIVSPEEGVGVEVTNKFQKEVKYNGHEKQVVFR